MTSCPNSSEGNTTKSSSAEATLTSCADLPSISVHTVKNNLQVLSSLCSLHSRSITDKAGLAPFSRVRGGLLLLSDAYELVHRTEHGDILPLGSFLPRIISRIAALYPVGNVPLRATASISDEPVPFSSAVSWALLLNEVIPHIASYLDAGNYSPEMSAMGMLIDASLTITFTSPARSGATSTTPPPETQTRTADLGSVGTALMRQCGATVTWINQNPPTLEVVFQSPVS